MSAIDITDVSNEKVEYFGKTVDSGLLKETVSYNGNSENVKNLTTDHVSCFENPMIFAAQNGQILTLSLLVNNGHKASINLGNISSPSPLIT